MEIGVRAKSLPLVLAMDGGESSLGAGEHQQSLFSA